MKEITVLSTLSYTDADFKETVDAFCSGKKFISAVAVQW